MALSALWDHLNRLVSQSFKLFVQLRSTKLTLIFVSLWISVSDWVILSQPFFGTRSINDLFIVFCALLLKLHEVTPDIPTCHTQHAAYIVILVIR